MERALGAWEELGLDVGSQGVVWSVETGGSSDLHGEQEEGGRLVHAAGD